MTPLDFLRAVWPENGYYCVATPFKVQDKTTYAHKVFPTIAAAAAAIERGKTSRDMFFCVHSLKQEKVWNPQKHNYKTGEPGAFEHRTHANMQESKAFFFDIDVGPSENKYTSQAEALADLRRFCQKAQLPKPLVVSSGGGLHVYWLLTSSLLSHEWIVYAARLRQLAAHHGLRIDPARTTDVSSVLRVSGSYNLKDPTNPRLVRALTAACAIETSALLDAIGKALIRAGVDAQPTRAPHASPQATELGSNTTREFDGPPVAFKAMVAACAQLQRIVRLQGNVSEPEWYHALNLIRFAVNGATLVHKVSAGHPGYAQDATDAKIAQLEAKDIQPTSCLKLAEVCGDAMCLSCPFVGKVRSPIVAARFKDEAPRPKIAEICEDFTQTLEVPSAPKPYHRLKDGRVTILAKNKEGDEMHTVISDYDFYPVRRHVDDKEKIERHRWLAHLPRLDAPKEIVIDADALYDERKLAATLSNQGVFPTHLKELRGYMIAYIQELQRQQAAEAQYHHLGWVDERSKFVLPDRVLLPDGTVTPATLSLGAARSSQGVKKSGTLAKQVELLDFYKNAAYIPNQFYILAALAAPIFYATGHHGVIVNASGEAGASKSTTLYTAASLWGSPEGYVINGTNHGATMRGRDARVAVLANLPVCVDEITHLPTKDAVDLAMSITQPGHRIRLEVTGVERAANETLKSTIMLTTANNSLHQLLSINNAAGTAGSMRVFEIEFVSHMVHTKVQADAYLREIKENYGHIGEALMRYVVQHRDAVAARVREMMAEIDIKAGVSGAERFWSAAAAAALTAGEIAVKLGLLSYNIAAIKHWAIVHQFPIMRGVVQEEYRTPASILTEYLGAIIDKTVVVNHEDYTGNISNIIHEARGELLARRIVDENVIWVQFTGFKSYCEKLRVSATAIIKKLQVGQMDADGVTHTAIPRDRKRVTLGKGTDFDTGQVWCFCVDLTHPEIAGFEHQSVKPKVQTANKPILRVV